MDCDKWKRKKTKALKDGDLTQLIVCCEELAVYHVYYENYHAALEEYEEMERAATALHSMLDVGRANRLIGEMYCEIDNYDKAIYHQQKHWDIARAQGDKIEEQRALATLGRTYLKMAEFYRESDRNKRVNALTKAKEFFTESLAVCEQLADSSVGLKQRMEMKARLFLNLGLVYDEEGHMDSAIEYINKSVLICKKMDLWEDLYRAYVNLGCTYNMNGLKKEAITTFDKAICVAERLTTKIASLCESLSWKAEALLGLPDFRGARQALLRAYKLHCPLETTRNEIERKLRIVAAMCETESKLLNIVPDEENGLRKSLYETLGDMASELKIFTTALTYYHLMLECVEKCGGDPEALIECYVSLAQTYKDNKQYKKAVEFFRKEVALEKGNNVESCETYLNIAELYQLMGKEANALEAFKAARLCAESSQNPKLLKTVLSKLMHYFNELNQTMEADTIRSELESMNGNDVSDEEDEFDAKKTSTEFGAHIVLDEISDEEITDQLETAKTSRTRAKSKSNLHKKNELGETPLHRAAITGNITLVSKLLDQGHSVDVRDYSGWTPLHEAANHGYLEIAELLLKKGAAVNDRGGVECNGITPLLDAATCGHFEMMDLLLKYKASPLMKNNDGMTVLDLMSEWKRLAEHENGGRLDPSLLAQYNTMYSKFKQILERAGCNTSCKVSTPMKSNLEVMRTSTRRIMYEEADDDINVKMPGLGRDGDSENHGSKTSSKSNRKVGAANDYESTMRALRFQSRGRGCSSLTQEPKLPALLRADAIVTDDWLEEDIVRPNKKMRSNEFLSEPQRRNRSPTEVRHDRSPIKRTPSPAPHFEEAYPDSSSQEFDWCRVNEQRNESSVTTSPIPDIHTPSTSGFCSNQLKVMNLSRRMEMLSGDEGRMKKFGKVETLVTSPMTTSVNCVKVLVEGKLLVVPVPTVNDHLNIEWLAEETAKRYKCLEGIEPKLSLHTSDGAFLLNSDPVSLILTMGELLGRVISWNLPSLVASYEEICAQNNIAPDNSVISVLDTCPATRSADFSCIVLSSGHLSCVMKVISRHHPLLHLSLSGNDISDADMKVVADSVTKLPQLRSLDLSSGNITSEGLSTLAQTVINNNGLQSLQTLVIGYNPLGDCLKPLGDLINHLPALKSLSIPSANLAVQSFRSHLDFTLDTLEIINVNYNDIGTEGIIDLLGRLNPRHIRELHLAYAGGKTIREIGVYLQMKAPPSLRLLDVSYCPASEDDMREFIQGLERCPHLEKLLLEGVCDLGPKIAHDLMACRSVRNLSLSGSLDVQQPLQVAENLANLAISSSSEQNWGRRGPFDYVTSSPVQNPAIN